MTTVIPEEALTWYYRHCATSYVDIARMSNVSKSWRNLTMKLSQDEPKDTGHCLAWFAPENIQMIRISRDNDNDDSSSDEQYRQSNRHSRSYLVCQEWRGYRETAHVLKHFGFTRSFCENMETEMQVDAGKEKLYYETTKTVIGATVARPESYCYCVEEDPAMAKSKNNAADNQERIRREQYDLAILQRKVQRRELQLDVLPRVLHRPNGRPCLQFLNGPGSHAVCMMTPLFACGPVTEPVTVLLIGIASEDGCFLSGLHKRFELGYLYPHDHLSEVTEQSSICIATDMPDQQQQQQQRSHSPELSMNEVMHEDSEDISEDDGDKCNCVFDGIANKYDEMDESEKSVHRGKLGPGHWHCIVAIFEGANSCIRIDGVPEPMRSENGAAAQHAGAVLDGLTIGSDHCFGMSLCSGQGSTDMEGAIAELAVFRGRLDEQDIRILEQKMMDKHNIAAPGTADRWKVDLWERQAEGLLVHNAKLSNRVPLRYLARNRAVAWQLQHPITEKSKSIPRIGSRPGGSSSEW